MKKNIIYTGIVVVLLIGIVIFLNIKSNDKNNNTIDTNIENNIVKNTTNDIENVVSTTGSTILENTNKSITSGAIETEDEKKIKEMNSYIKSKIISFEGEDGKIYKQFQNNFNENFKNNVDIETIKNTDIMKGGIQDIVVDVQIFDVNTRKGVQNAEIYFWGYYVGITDEKGFMKRSINIPKSIKIFNIMSFKSGYINGFFQIIRGEKDGGELRFDMGVQKVDQYKGIKSDNIAIKKENLYKFTLKGDCNFLTSDGECYNGLLDIDIGYIDPKETEERKVLALPMDSITPDKSELHSLKSGGMAFINVYDQDGNILEKAKDKEFEMCYYMPPVYWKIEEEWVKQKLENGGEIGFGDQWNYWWFDKSKDLWIADKEAIKETGENWICFQTDIIY